MALEGAILGNKYRLLSLLGTGGMGHVYQAEQIGLGRSVAVKLLRRDLGDDGVARFRAEALSASRINHPHAVAIYDFGVTESGSAYLVMEHLRGQTLARLVAQQPLAPRRIITLGVQVLSALAEAHACGVVHCDLTSDNVIVERLRHGDDFAKVIDFGLARVFDAQSRDPDVIGTPEFMAPEQIQGVRAEPATDIYAMGVLLYEMIVGRTPFAGMPVQSILTAHLSGTPLPPHQVIPTCPRSLSDVVLWALAKAPEDRPPTAQAMREELMGILGGDRSARFCALCGEQIPGGVTSCRQCGAGLDGIERARGTGTVSDDRRIALGSQSVTRDPSGDQTRSTRRTSRLSGRFDKLPADLIGRQTEFSHVIDFCCRVDSPATLAVVGPEGIGKARLVVEATRHLEPRVSGFIAAADPTGLTRSWYPVLSMLEIVLGLDDRITVETISQAVTRVGLPERDVVGLCEVFGIRTQARELEGAVRLREAQAAALRALMSVQRRFPRAVLCFADIHEYDGPSQAFLARLASQVEGTSVRLIATTTDPSLAPRGADILRLDGLAPHHARELTAKLASDSDNLPTALAIHSLTLGSPAAIEHLAGWLLMGNSPNAAPPNLVDLVSTRVGRLSAEARRVLQAVAVHGTVAPRWLVEATLGDETLVDLDAPAWTGLLVVDDDELRIPTNLVANVVTECTPADVRRCLHRRALRTLFGRATHGVLAHHAEHAGELDAAHQFYTAGGDDAAHRFDDGGAVMWHRRAVDTARRLYTSGATHGESKFVASATRLAELLCRRGESRLAIALLDEAEDLAMNDAAVAAISHLRALSALQIGEFEDAIFFLQRAIGVGMRAGDREFLCNAYLDLAKVMDRAGKTGAGTEELIQGIDVITAGAGLRASDGPTRLWNLGFKLAQRLLQFRRLDKARRVADDALVQARLVGSARGRGRLSALLAQICEAAGDVAAAQKHRANAIEEMSHLGDRQSTAELLYDSAQASGRFTTSSRVADRGVRLANKLAAEIGWGDDPTPTDDEPLGHERR